MRFAILGLAAAMIAAPAAAQSMNAEQFHRRATALQKKGAAAVFSMGEVKKLMREVQAAGEKNRAARLAAAAAGRTPRYCPPEQAKGKGKGMDSKEFMQRMSAIPVAERTRIDITEASARIMANKYPCPA
ncbi:MAG: hypothetical protein M3Q57_04210 [Pseudomonadota bacterium]|nr:hypothetical protein [Pseudomonadota bacterium]